MIAPDVTDAPDRQRVQLRLPSEVKRRAMVDAARYGRTLNDHVAIVLDAVLPSAEPPAAG